MLFQNIGQLIKFCQQKSWKVYFCYITCKKISGKFREKKSMANISNMLYLILSNEIGIFCKDYSSVIYLCFNDVIPTLHTTNSVETAK